MSDRTTRLVAVYAIVASIVALCLSPLLALSYFNTIDGVDELESGTVSGWAVPARELVGGLLTWAAPEQVYTTFVQVFALLFPAVFVCALVARGRRPNAPGPHERWGWRITLLGYGWAMVGLIGAFVVLFMGASGNAALDVVYMGLMVPGMFISAIGSSVLGIALLRTPFTPKLTSWLLTLALPSMLVIPDLLGHNSLGMLPLFLAWGASGVQLLRIADRPSARQYVATRHSVGAAR